LLEEGDVLAASVVQRIQESPTFEATRSPYLVVDRDLCIRAVNPAYAQATGRARNELLSRPMFDAFPPNPDDATDDGAARLEASFETVLTYGVRHYMGLQRYDILQPGEPPTFHYRVWAPVNSPIRDERGQTVAVLHHAEDVTLVVPRQMDAPADGAVDGSGADPALAVPERWMQLVAALHDVRAAHADTSAQFETLRGALDTNRQIATAVGMLMSSAQISQDEAFNRLVRTSQQAHRKLRDVAADIVSGFSATLSD
jgi:hypothetical protein